MEPLTPLRRSTDDYPRTKWEVAGYVLAHPRTWCLILGLAFAWQCFGMREWAHAHGHSVAVESSAHAAVVSVPTLPSSGAP